MGKDQAKSTLETVDVLAIGAHPDDVEIGAGGYLAKTAGEGHRVGILDLTQGEMATVGTPEKRQEEARKAAACLGVAWRYNLRLPDGEVGISRRHLEKVVEVLRLVRPALVLAPYGEDRHPDHRRCAHLVEEACFLSGLAKYQADIDPYRPQALIYYCVNSWGPPSFLVDVSPWYKRKQEALAAYESQFFRGDRDKQRELRIGDFLYAIESRERFFGSQIGVAYAEGYIYKGMLPIADPLRLWG